MRIRRALAALTIAMLTFATAQATEITGDELKKAMQENPNVLIEAIRANKKAIFDIINQTGLEKSGDTLLNSWAGGCGIQYGVPVIARQLFSSLGGAALDEPVKG